MRKGLHARIATRAYLMVRHQVVDLGRSTDRKAAELHHEISYRLSVLRINVGCIGFKMT